MNLSSSTLSKPFPALGDIEREGKNGNRKDCGVRNKPDSIVILHPTMTTFTKLPDGEQPLIEVDAGKKLSKIDDMIYGGFTE